MCLNLKMINNKHTLFFLVLHQQESNKVQCQVSDQEISLMAPEPIVLQLSEDWIRRCHPHLIRKIKIHHPCWTDQAQLKMIFKPLPGMLFLKSQSLEIRLTLQLKKQMCKNRRIYILCIVLCNLQFDIMNHFGP